MQEVVPSDRCLQQVFLHAKPNTVCELHCLSLIEMSSSVSLRANMMSSIKPEIHNISIRPQKRIEPRPAIGNVHKNWRKSGV